MPFKAVTRDVTSSVLRYVAGPLGGGVDFYSIAGASPELVAAFSGDYYRANGSATTFDGLFNFSASSNATMVDSDGLLKWRPHNLCVYSGDLNQAFATPFGNTIKTVVSGTSPVGTSSTILRAKFTVAGALGAMRRNVVLVVGATYTFSVWVRRFSGTGDLQVDNRNNLPSTTFSGITTDWSLLNYEFVADATSSWIDVECTVANTIFEFDGGQVYRSDLGGMVDNPDRGDSYVPTTSSAVYLPRRGHHVWNGSAWVNKGVLIESESRTNRITNSNFQNNWTQTRSVLAGNSATSISGANDAVLLSSDTTASNSHNIQHIANTSATDAPALFSVYAKAGTERYIQLRVIDDPANAGGGSNDYAAHFDLLTGTLTSHGGFNGSALEPVYGIEPHGDTGWYLCWVGLKKYGGATRTDTQIYLTQTSTLQLNPLFNGTGAENVLIYEAALEEAKQPSSVIPTNGATVTRAGDVLTIPAANLPYSSTAMSIQMQGEMTYADTDEATVVQFFDWSLDGSNYIRSRLNVSSTRTGEYDTYQSESGVVDLAPSAADQFSPGVNVPFNIASRHGSTFINGAVDGTALTADTTPVALPDLSATDLQLGYDFMGTISLFRMWADDLGDAGIAEASA